MTITGLDFEKEIGSDFGGKIVWERSRNREEGCGTQSVVLLWRFRYERDGNLEQGFGCERREE